MRIKSADCRKSDGVPERYARTSNRVTQAPTEKARKFYIGVPRRSDGFSVVVSDTHQTASIVSAQVIDVVPLGDPLGMSELLVVEVEVHPLVHYVVHCTGHRHRPSFTTQDAGCTSVAWYI